MSKTLPEKIAVMQAALDGEVVEYLSGTNQWKALPELSVDDIIFDWNTFDYRIRTEPMEFWVNVYEDNFSKLSCVAIYETKREAFEGMAQGCLNTIKVREVTDESGD